ncbi:MAG TPA: hypothetical protein VFT05_08970 [Burkholderiaceae bacterium]|nr:hypothetical protein [Burkholderiaceae bacterium]
MKKLSLILMLALSACGGSSGEAGGPPPMAPPATAAPPTVADAFITALLALLGADGDSAEPAAVDTFAATAPEDSEPAPVK